MREAEETIALTSPGHYAFSHKVCIRQRQDNSMLSPGCYGSSHQVSIRLRRDNYSLSD